VKSTIIDLIADYQFFSSSLYSNLKVIAVPGLATILHTAPLICSGENLEQLLDTVETELKKMKSWFDANKLTLNLNKAKFIIFSNCGITLNKKKYDK